MRFETTNKVSAFEIDVGRPKSLNTLGWMTLSLLASFAAERGLVFVTGGRFSSTPSDPELGTVVSTYDLGCVSGYS